MPNKCKCGATPILYDNNCRPDGYYSKWQYAVICKSCKHEGEFFTNKEEAIAAWNKEMEATNAE